MAKVQTKINFQEKKKTSERLQSVFSKKELNSKTVLKPCDTNFKSPRKKQIAALNLSPSKKSLECHNIQDKENDANKNEICLNILAELESFCTDSETNVVPKKSQERLRHSPRKRQATPSKIKPSDGGSSPPKRDCTKVATSGTPSQLITKLVLNSPEKPQSRKELFPKGDFDEACKALHSSAPTSLPGREDKLDYIKQFLQKHCAEESSGSMYVSGPPGTGKTACVNIAVSDRQIAEAYDIVCLNCTSLNTSGSVYSRIVKELGLKSGTTEKTCLAAIEKHLHSVNRKMILIVLDEMDQLCSNKQSVLYSIFEWPALEDSRLVLIGIANALDLTDRLLPRLQAKLALQPSVLHFPSYTRQQIIDIISDRLRQAGVEEVFSGATLPLLAGKVAAINGDVRRALDIARRVVEVAERRMVSQPLSDNGNSKQTVALQEVMTVVNDVYSTAQSLDSSQAGSFPLQQKLLICSLLLIRQKSKSKDCTIGKLHEVYKKVCEKRNMSALDISEFISLTSLVESRGILRVSGKTRNRLSKIILQWDESEVNSALQDKQLLAAVLMDKGVIS